MVKRYLGQGLSYNEIARLVGISPQGVHHHVKQLRRDGELPSPNEAAV